VPWTLRFPFDTVDARVFARQAISELRRDPAVTDVQLNPALPRSAWFDTLLVQVEFLEGHDQPADAVLADRLLVFRPQEPRRNNAMTENFERLYGVRGTPHRTPEERDRLWNTLLNPDRPNENGDHIPQEVRERIIQQYLGNPEGRQRLGASMANSLRTRRDYTSVARRVFLVDQLPEGALPVYDRDPNVAEAVVGNVSTDLNGQPFVLPDWVQPGAFARFKGEENRIVEIDRVETPGGGVSYVLVDDWKRVGTWVKDPNPEGNNSIRADFFARLWEPCERPADPKTAWDRLLGDEPDEDAPCGPQEPVRTHDPTRTAWDRLRWDEPWRGPLLTDPLPEGALPVYD